ncbi:MAG TPA: LacI family DNA-binding transcriptional regulator [Phycisphaerae bacterium]|nr:LacI family DNA-binding transcriptional regulator [Phycisphaerae bacterium]
MSIKDVARESGASLTTVSLVLNKRDRRISRETRERILNAVNRLGYRPSRLAQGLQSQRAGFIAVLVPQLGHAFADACFGELISAIQETSRAADYKLILKVADPNTSRQASILNCFAAISSTDSSVSVSPIAIGTSRILSIPAFPRSS